MKKAISLVLAVAMLLSMLVFVQAEEAKIDYENKICTIRLKDGGYLSSATSEKKSDLVISDTAKEWKIKEYLNTYSFEDGNDFYWDVLDVSTKPGAKLIQWSFTGVGNQIWAFEEAEGGVYIKNVLSNLYVTEKDGAIIQEEKAEGANQIWVIDIIGEFEPIVEKMLESEAVQSLDSYRLKRLTDYITTGAEFNIRLYSAVENMIKERDYFNLTLEEQKAFIDECFKMTHARDARIVMKDMLEREVTAEYVGIIYDVWGEWHGIPENDARLYNVTITDPATGESHVMEYVSPFDNDEEAAIVAGKALGSFEMPVVKLLKRFIYTSMNTRSWNGGGGMIWNNTGAKADRRTTVLLFGHELGHVMDVQRHDIWYRAMALDMVPVSSYGNTNRWEDLAEFSQLFLSSRGDEVTRTALEKTFPARTLAFKSVLYEKDNEFYAEYKDEHELVMSMFGDYDKSEIVTLATDGKYLTDNNGVLELVDKNDSEEQIWTVYTADFGTSRFENKKTGKYIAVADGKLTLSDAGSNFGFVTTDEGCRMVQSDTGFIVLSDLTTDVAGDAVWKMDKIGEIPSVGTNKIKTVSGESLVLNEDGLDKWVFTPVERDYYVIKDKATGKVLDILDHSKESGAEVILWTSTGADNQKFKIKDNGDGTVFLVAKNSGFAVTLENGKVFQGNGTRFILEKTEEMTDVKEKDWYYAVVEKVLSLGWMEAVSKDTFGAKDEITRGEFVEALYRAEGAEANGECRFEDVTDSFTKEAVVWAVENGIINGVTEKEFKPEALITREQIAAIFHRYAVYKKCDVSVGEDTNILSYVDFEEISEYAIPSLQWATGSGLMKGKSESTLDPRGNTTKAETATLLVRMVEDIAA